MTGPGPDQNLTRPVKTMALAKFLKPGPGPKFWGLDLTKNGRPKDPFRAVWPSLSGPRPQNLAKGKILPLSLRARGPGSGRGLDKSPKGAWLSCELKYI